MCFCPFACSTSLFDNSEIKTWEFWKSTGQLQFLRCPTEDIKSSKTPCPHSQFSPFSSSHIPYTSNEMKMKQVAMNGEVSLCMCDVCSVAVLLLCRRKELLDLEWKFMHGNTSLGASRGSQKPRTGKKCCCYRWKERAEKEENTKKNYERRIRTQSQTRTFFFFFSPCSFDFRLT